MNRRDLQRLANKRVREAKALLDADEYSGAYYLIGYAVECALKACIAKSVQRHDFPDRRVRDLFTHDLQKLVGLAGLKDALEADRRINGSFEASWDVTCRWSEESRYSQWTRNDAQAIIDAVTERKDGVLPWIKQRW